MLVQSPSPGLEASLAWAPSLSLTYCYIVVLGLYPKTPEVITDQAYWRNIALILM
jgi:hypothetical protein